jgi:hypothetical protein
LYQNTNVKVVTHTDCDEIILNAQYLVGLSNILLDSGKAIMGAQTTWVYDMDSMTEDRFFDGAWGEESYWNNLLHAFVVINKERVPFGSYFPIQFAGNFHKDLWSHFINSGYQREDAYILKRKVFDYDIPPNALYSFNFNMGILHSSNMLEYPEDTDRKIRLLRLMEAPKWDSMTDGYKWNYNEHSPRKNYKRTDGLPYTDYKPILPKEN